MTISTATSPEESLPTGVPSSPTAPTAEVIYREFDTARPLPLSNTKGLETLLQEFEADQEMAGYLAEARRNLAAQLYVDEPETLSALRLTAGLSQAQLAERAHTTQPYIARIERGRADPSTDMIARIAEALGVKEEQAFRAIRNQLATRGSNNG